MLLVGCPARSSAPGDAAATGAALVQPAFEGGLAPQARSGAELVRANCLACHSEEMLQQQRLPQAKWAAVVKKMSGWGAPIEPENTEALVNHLTAAYGPDAGPYAVATVGVNRVSDDLSPTADGPFAGGDAERGHTIYRERCAACHGDDARGQLGVNLVDRPLLYRAEDVAMTVRNGRGKMPPFAAAKDGEIADLLAHLRRLRSVPR